MTATPIYCQVTDIARVLQKANPFTTSSTPSADDVANTIEEAEAEIDQTTQHAWTARPVLNEFYDLPSNYNPESYGYNSGTGIEVQLRHRKIKSATPVDGDKLEVWNGSSYDDWFSTKTEGRGNDFWFDNEQGTLYLRYYFAYFKKKALRLSYRYGDETTIPKDIQKACALMVAIKLIQSDDRSMMLNETGDPTRETYDTRIAKWQKEIDRILRNRTEFKIIQ